MFNRALLPLAALLFVGACSGPNQDVRLTLCQGLVEGMLPAGVAVEWREHEAVMKGYEDLEMRVTFEQHTADGDVRPGEAVCFYPYEQDLADAQSFADPTSAYASNPSRMLFGGEPLEGRRLGERVNAVMVEQGRAAVERGREVVDRAVERVGEEVKSLSQ